MANATIGTGDNIGFTMVNANNTSSWTLNLGVSVSDLAAGTVGTFSINVLDELGLAEMVDGYSWSVLGGIQEGISAFGYFATLKSSVTPNNKTSAQTAGAIGQIDNYFTDNGNGTNGPVPNGATGFYNNAGSFQGDCNGACAPVARGNEETVPMDGSSMMPFYFQQAISGVESQANLLGTFTLLDDGTLTYAPVPIPAAVWMFGSVIAGMFGFARARKAKQ
jgi:hypothetical protein